MSITVREPTTPDADSIATADAALDRVKSFLASRPSEVTQIRLRVAENGDELVVPRAAVELFAQILAHMAAGHGVSVVPGHAELTTQQAAELLNVSRPYLIGLLDAGEIEYRRVGKHRRVRASSLLAYIRSDEQRRRAAADELSNLTEELGLYE